MVGFVLKASTNQGNEGEISVEEPKTHMGGFVITVKAERGVEQIVFDRSQYVYLLSKMVLLAQ